MFYIILESSDGLMVLPDKQDSKEAAESIASLRIKRGDKVWSQEKSEMQPIVKANICQVVSHSETAVSFVEGA